MRNTQYNPTLLPSSATWPWPSHFALMGLFPRLKKTWVHWAWRWNDRTFEMISAWHTEVLDKTRLKIRWHKQVYEYRPLTTAIIFKLNILNPYILNIRNFKDSRIRGKSYRYFMRKQVLIPTVHLLRPQRWASARPQRNFHLSVHMLISFFFFFFYKPLKKHPHSTCPS